MSTRWRTDRRTCRGRIAASGAARQTTGGRMDTQSARTAWRATRCGCGRAHGTDSGLGRASGIGVEMGSEQAVSQELLEARADALLTEWGEWQRKEPPV